MNCATTTLLLLLGATASCHAFVMTPSSPALPYPTTALAVYHYVNGAEPDPSSTAKKPESEKELKPVFPTYGTPEPKPPLGDNVGESFGKELKPVFPTYGTPEPKPPLGDNVGGSSKKKGLDRVFLDWEDRGFSADGLQRPSS